MADSVQLTFGYQDTEFERTYEIDVAESVSSADIKSKVLAINASLAASTDGGLSNFFTSDEGDNFTRIIVAKRIHKEELYVDLGGE